MQTSYTAYDGTCVRCQIKKLNMTLSVFLHLGHFEQSNLCAVPWNLKIWKTYYMSNGTICLNWSQLLHQLSILNLDSSLCAWNVYMKTDFGTLNERAHEIMVLITLATSEGSGELFAHKKCGNRRRVWPKIRHLAPPDGCECAFEEWVYGGRKVHVP